MISKRSNIFAIGLLLFFVLWSLYTLIEVTIKAYGAPPGSTDFHSYWYSGHFVRQGTNPYAAYFARQQPQIPVSYLDGKVVTAQPVGQPGLATAPANTAPIVLLLSLFSFFSWPLAQSGWFIINLLLALAIPLMIVRLWLYNTCANRKILTAVMMFCLWLLPPAQSAIVVGQTTLFVFALMLVALAMADKNWALSGLALGIALSKYSLALPVFIFLLLRRRYAVVGVSLAVQALGLLGLAFLTNVSPGQVLHEYVLMMNHHISFEGIHLSYSIGRLMLDARLMPAFLTSALFTLLVWAPLGLWLRRYFASLPADVMAFAEMHIFTILSLWTLLVAYHRHYDAALWIIFIGLILRGLEFNHWQLSRRWRWTLALFVAILYFVRPYSIMSAILPDSLDRLFFVWESLWDVHITVNLLLSLILTVILLYRLSAVQSQKHARGLL